MIHSIVPIQRIDQRRRIAPEQVICVAPCTSAPQLLVSSPLLVERRDYAVLTSVHQAEHLEHHARCAFGRPETACGPQPAGAVAEDLNRRCPIEKVCSEQHIGVSPEQCWPVHWLPLDGQVAEAIAQGVEAEATRIWGAECRLQCGNEVLLGSSACAFQDGEAEARRDQRRSQCVLS